MAWTAWAWAKRGTQAPEPISARGLARGSSFPLFCEVRSRLRRMALQQRRHLLGGQRFAEQKALELVAAVGAQELPLLGGLDALCDDLQAQAVAESDHTFGNRHVVCVVRNVFDERAV